MKASTLIAALAITALTACGGGQASLQEIAEADEAAAQAEVDAGKVPPPSVQWACYRNPEICR